MPKRMQSQLELESELQLEDIVQVGVDSHSWLVSVDTPLPPASTSNAFATYPNTLLTHCCRLSRVIKSAWKLAFVLRLPKKTRGTLCAHASL